MTSNNFAYDQKSIREVDQLFTRRDFYVSPDGKLRNSPVEYIAELTIQNLN